MERSRKKRYALGFGIVLLAVLVVVLLWPRGGEDKVSDPGKHPSPSTQEASPSGEPTDEPVWTIEDGALHCLAGADDRDDDLKTLEACTEKAKADGLQLRLSEGEYRIDDIWVIDGVKVQGAGADKTVIVSTDPKRGSIDLEGSGPSLSDLSHVYARTVKRGNGENAKNSITVRAANGFRIENVHIDKASTAGILVQESSEDGVIANNLIENTGADGIHVTDGSTRIRIEDNKVSGTGDDAIAVVSYLKDEAVTHDVTIAGNDVGYDSKARGISVVGGEDVTIEDNSIQRTEMAGIYISVEKEWETADTKNVTVQKNTIEHTGMRESSDHPNILVYASQGKLDDITFEANTIKNAVNDGIGVWGDGDLGNIYFSNNVLSDSSKSPTNFKGGNIHLEGNTGF
ncbi:parallel beta-helix repeat (two copies) [Cohnella sp. OV330]|uniref:right-handed parallel beta-helix repeat-containing protein n=1 Tax=Cohnella sp. OV330 TaxID=1855288 RepID=UPI0008E8A534|nr:right-handed parallel beta-helix repeat-containing protein [Cohnella sp. OV330]SFB53613.1 parallel beta-helix repeat (two copies) [Cohnella sp. OV330]